jgi:G3E family GTPase
VDPDALNRVRVLCRDANGHAPIVETSHASVDPALLFDIHLEPGRQLMLGQTVDHEHHLHTHYEAMTFRTDRPLDPRRFAVFFDDRPAGAYRIKGFAYFGVTGHRQRFIVHAVGRYLRFDRTPWPRGEPRETALEIIGSDLDRGLLEKTLRACERAEPAEEDSILPVIRYTFS